jgi:hypothetical protein
MASTIAVEIVRVDKDTLKLLKYSLHVWLGELSILALRNILRWGTARIQQGLIKLPGFIREATGCVQGVSLSRESINNVLTRHGLNGYPRNYKRWRFFRAKASDELWQIDFKGPYTVQGRRHWFLVCIDDYSRYLVLAEQFDYRSPYILSPPGVMCSSMTL